MSPELFQLVPKLQLGNELNNMLGLGTFRAYTVIITLRIMYIKTKAVLTAFTVVTLPIYCIHAQDREPASGAKAPEKSNESASGAKASEKKPEKSDSQKPINRASEPMDKTEKATMKRVTGIGGVFIKAKDPAKLRAWYKTHLGIDVQTWGGATFRWGTQRTFLQMPKPPGSSVTAPISNRAMPRS